MSHRIPTIGDTGGVTVVRWVTSWLMSAAAVFAALTVTESTSVDTKLQPASLAAVYARADVLEDDLRFNCHFQGNRSCSPIRQVSYAR